MDLDLLHLLLLLHLHKLGDRLLGDEHGLTCDHHLLGGRNSLDLALVNATLVVLAGLAQDDVGDTASGGLLRGDTGSRTDEGTEGLAGFVLEDVSLLDGSHRDISILT